MRQITGAPITAFHFVPARAWRMRSWDRFMVPKPFSRIVLSWAKVTHVPADLTTEAFELLQFLGHQPVHFPASPHSHQLPLRREVAGLSITENDVFNRTYVQALQSGQGFPTIRLCGSLEGKLIAAIVDIWAQRYAHPEEDLDTCLHKSLDPLAQRMDVVLGN